MNEINKSKLYLAVLMIATLLSFAVLEGLKKAGQLPEFRDNHRLYLITTGVILVALIGVVSVALRQRDKAED
ncbi:hypothetical protein GCM10011386_45620 [Parapedobacter defluvii]|uniref:Gram-positive cocci surface proteins LPxTG domain-containing protein n=1 Tax=Parapedobacter defluvii TaxID=2045106 RepID=A0ABQ1N0E5_9SPHI|nr:hypothetical protein [Parapedobacter defluvii]RQP16979.1 MAG: hypothetical protein EAS52_10100 [Parapedobacter sp.]GGC48278.1 hypothetical protein GCM10011386_45620 [Parapedobacter defluvii]